MSAVQERRATFARLHEKGCFVIPNPWDVGTARALQRLGFPALATTSAGFAFSRGLPDSVSVLSRGLVLDHVTDIVAATDLPVNADFQSGYAETPEGVADSVRLCIETGVAGLSIEDATGDRDRPLRDLGRRSRGSPRRAPRSTRAAPASCSRAGPRATSSDSRSRSPT